MVGFCHVGNLPESRDDGGGDDGGDDGGDGDGDDGGGGEKEGDYEVTHICWIGFISKFEREGGT